MKAFFNKINVNPNNILFKIKYKEFILNNVTSQKLTRIEKLSLIRNEKYRCFFKNDSDKEIKKYCTQKMNGYDLIMTNLIINNLYLLEDIKESYVKIKENYENIILLW